MKIAGILLIALGLFALITGGISFTKKEKVVDLGPIDVIREKKTSQPIPIVAGIGAVLAGGFMLVAGTRKNA